LAKIEQSSIHQIKATHKKNASSKPGSQSVTGKQAQTKSKPMKFSYHAPKAAGNSGLNAPPSSPNPSARTRH